MRLLPATLLFFLISCAKYQVNADGEWCYEDPECGPSHWTGPCKSGKSQSPIDLNSTLSQKGPSSKLRFDKQYFQEYDKFYILNNGHSIQVQLQESPNSHGLMDAEGLKGSYVFAQAHFHWGGSDDVGSEHTVDGKHYPMELHFVHYSDRYPSLASALQDNNRRALAVLGIFFEVTERDNPALQSIIEAIPQVLEPEHPIVTKSFQGSLNLTALLPRPLHYWRYEGSLTTPNCAEKVVWTVFHHPVGISEKQLNVFRSAKDSHGKPLVNNYRPAQAIAKRTIKFMNVDRWQVKMDDDNNEIEDDVDSSTDGLDSTDDGHGHGIDHEDEGTNEVDNSIASQGGNSKKNNGHNGSPSQFETPATLIFILICACIPFTMRKL